MLLQVDLFHFMEFLKLFVKDIGLLEYLADNLYLGFTFRLVIIVF